MKEYKADLTKPVRVKLTKSQLLDIGFAAENAPALISGFFGGSRAQFEREAAFSLVLDDMNNRKSRLVHLDIPSDSFSKIYVAGIESLKKGGYLTGPDASSLYVTDKLLNKLMKNVTHLRQDMIAAAHEFRDVEMEAGHIPDGPKSVQAGKVLLASLTNRM